jgi:threonine/homoserine/homoserine lactone efflux protein
MTRYYNTLLQEKVKISLMEQFILIASAHFIALLSPGVDFVYILKSATSYRFSVAIGSAFGIAVSNGIYILLTLLGYAKVITNSEFLVLCIQIIGGLYLCYLGIMILKVKNNQIKIDKNNQQSNFSKEFMYAFLTSMLNPKISLFYISLFTLIIDPKTALTIQVWYGVWMFFAVLFWDLFLIYLINRHLAKNIIFALKSIEKVIGIILLCMGIGLLMQIRSLFIF